MRDARIRLLLNPKLEDYEKKAAESAASRFKAYGLKVETIAGPDSPVWKDLCRTRVFDAVYKDGPPTLHGSEPFGRPVYPVPNDGAILAGLTPHQIGWVSGGSVVPLEGFNLQMVGSVVSTASLKPSVANPYRGGGPASFEEAAEAIRLSMTHELGHALLGREPVTNFGTYGPLPYDDEGHCVSSDCVMRKVADYVSLLRTAAASRLDFCERCGDLLKSRVSYINYLGAA